MSAKSTKLEKNRFFGPNFDQVIKRFFGGKAIVAIVVLALVAIFLFCAGAIFFPGNLRSLELYRQTGLEYVDYVRGVVDAHTALSRYLQDLRKREVSELQKTKSSEQSNAALADFDNFAGAFDSTIDDLRSLLSHLTDTAAALQEKLKMNEERVKERSSLLAAGRQKEAEQVQITTIDLKQELRPIQASLPVYQEEIVQLKKSLETLTGALPVLPASALQPRMEKFKSLTRQYLAELPAVEQKLKSWDPEKPVEWYRVLFTFFGAK